MSSSKKIISDFLLKKAPQLFQKIQPNHLLENPTGKKFGIIGSNPKHVNLTSESLFDFYKELNNPKTDQEFPSGISYILPSNNFRANFRLEIEKLSKAGCKIIIITDANFSKKDEQEIAVFFPKILFVNLGNELFQNDESPKKPSDKKSHPIGIIGGMGPFATLFSLNRYFFPEIDNAQSELFRKAGVVVSFGCDIPDRTKYLLDPKNNQNPTQFIQRDAAILHEIFGCLVKTITCNTAHAFLKFLSQEEKYGKTIDMIKETANACQNSKKILLTATAGTIEVGLYQKVFAEIAQNSDLKLLVTNQDQTARVMEIIYGKSGVKTGNVGEENQKKYAEVINEFGDLDQVIGGCTELPLINQKLDKAQFIDPMQIAALTCAKYVF